MASLVIVDVHTCWMVFWFYRADKHSYIDRVDTDERFTAATLVGVSNKII